MKQVRDFVGVSIKKINDIAGPDIIFCMYELFEFGGITWDYVSQHIGRGEASGVLAETGNYLFDDAVKFWLQQWNYEWQRFRIANEVW
jgi:hypothetical protein